MKCPKCSAEIPDDIIRSEGARLMAEARKHKVGGFADKRRARKAGNTGVKNFSDPEAVRKASAKGLAARWKKKS
jgi:hypothetical protein